MGKIELICVGALKFKDLQNLEQYYLKKIGYFVKLKPVIIKDIRLPDEDIRKQKEGEAMTELLQEKDLVIALDEKGRTMDSTGFARWLDDKLSHHPGRIVFLIGGHAGLSAALDQRIDLKLSFSALTFGHDIFRILFLEQLYRAFTIIKGLTYHR